MLSGKATNTNFIVFGLTRLRLEPPIYRTRGEHANHYATDAAKKKLSRKLQEIHKLHYYYRYIPKLKKCGSLYFYLADMSSGLLYLAVISSG